MSEIPWTPGMRVRTSGIPVGVPAARAPGEYMCVYVGSVPGLLSLQTYKADVFVTPFTTKSFDSTMWEVLSVPGIMWKMGLTIQRRDKSDSTVWLLTDELGRAVCVNDGLHHRGYITVQIVGYDPDLKALDPDMWEVIDWFPTPTDQTLETP